MLNKGLHSEKTVRSQKSEVRRTYDLLLATYDYSNPQNEFAYELNQTKIKTESLAMQKRLFGVFLLLAEGEYAGQSTDGQREGVILLIPEPVTASQSIPNLPQTDLSEAGEQGMKTREIAQHTLPLLSSFLHPVKGEYSRFIGREGVNSSQMQITQSGFPLTLPQGEMEGASNLTTSSVFEEGMLTNNLTFKQTNDHKYFPLQGKCPDMLGQRGQKKQHARKPEATTHTGTGTNHY